MSQDSTGSSDRETQVNEIIAAYLEAIDAGQKPDRQEWLRRYPEFAPDLEAFLKEYGWMDRLGEPTPPNAETGAPAPQERVVSSEPATMDFSQPDLAQPVGEREPAGRWLIVAGLTIFVLASLAIGLVLAEYFAVSERRAIDEKQRAITKAKHTPPWSSAAPTMQAARDARQSKGTAVAAAIPPSGALPEMPSPPAQWTATLSVPAAPAQSGVFHMPGWQTSLQFVTVGDPGNVADTTGFGAVPYLYRMGRYDVTAAQYITFLNAVATTADPYGLYTSNMASDISQGCGIFRSGSPGSYRYATSKNGNFPVNYVSWGDAARFCNWLQHGQPSGAEGNGTTETGAYTLNGATANLTQTRNTGAIYFIPTENEWYKAAYYKGGGKNAGYWLYTTRSDTAPINTLPDMGNRANYKDLFGTGNKGYTDAANRLTPVGYFLLSFGPYRTYDMGGDVAQWNESVFPGAWRGLRGGDFYSSSDYLRSSNQDKNPSDDRYCGLGFRVASVPDAPIVIAGNSKPPVDTFLLPPDSQPLHSIAWQDVRQGFNANIYQTGVSADGNLFFGAGDAGPAGSIRIFEVATGKQVQELLPGKDVWFSFAAFVPGGKYLAAGYNQDKDLYLWDIATGKVVRKFVGHTDGDNGLAVSPDGKRMLSWGKDRTLRLWDVETGKQLKKLEGHTDKAQGVFSPDGKSILTFSPDKTLRLWDADSGKELKKLTGHDGAVTGCFSPDGKQILSSSPDHTIRLWDVETGKEIRHFGIPKEKTLDAYFVACGRRVAARCDDRKFRLWETANGKLLREIDLSELGGDRWKIMTASPDGRLGLVSLGDGSVRVYDLASGALIHQYAGAARAQSFSFTPDGNFAVSGSFRRGLYVFRFPK
jgi:formylglycine-generating enzyme